MKLRKSTKVALSHDEHLQRYFQHLERDYLRTLKRGRVVSIMRIVKDGYVSEQIENMFDTPDGTIVYIR